jgi:hypothetical protein
MSTITPGDLIDVFEYSGVLISCIAVENLNFKRANVSIRDETLVYEVWKCEHDGKFIYVKYFLKSGNIYNIDDIELSFLKHET